MVKNVNRIEPRKKPRRLRIRVPSQIRRIFNYKCYITFLTGFYSCHWGFRQWEKTELGSCCCSRREQVFFVFLVISFSLSAATLFVWVETSNEYFDFDWVTYLGTKRWFFWSIFILSLAGIMVAYTSLLLVITFLLLRERIELYLHTCHKVFICLLILLCVFLLVILSKFWQDKWMIVGLSLRIFAPYVHLCSIVLMSLISWPLAFYVSHLEAEIRIRRFKMTCSDVQNHQGSDIFRRLRALQVAAGLPFAILLLCLYLLPLGVYSPCILKKEDLAPRPLFVAHRGAPMVAPENTMMSFQKAVEFGTYALETDVYLSYDKVSFLMHDFDLSRTTNIREVMPSAAYETPAAFYWNFLKTLNAGKWFVEQMPYYNMKPLSEADKRRARNQSIPRLVDLLEFAKKEKKFLIFDLFRPPPSHPLRGDFIQHVVEEILKSKIEQHLILWLPNQERDYVQRAAPGFQQVGRLNPVHRLVKENISKINVDYKTLFYNGMKEYKDANININLYLVNEPWLFSLAWCSRINSVTTDNIPVLSQLNYPYFFMTPGYYTCMWLLVDFTSAVLVALVCCFHWWKEAKKERRLEVCSIAPGKASGPSAAPAAASRGGEGEMGPGGGREVQSRPPHPRLAAEPSVKRRGALGTERGDRRRSSACGGCGSR
ncbi:glycerophosphodiester phosphodiesterase domain-containing protein 4 [Perognathus longimembris pacificus]|uniref:glycerophosphodiester phosphodiesterase domain-containing protein 4 n=1 Tax=Perognathus longimembris pacificus TaxID=214514 RepID=UPI00201A0E12|nr:glycerophosphodiester phosphodiesterase domain-containing protein 4 [Perognathus longimembris pacificus]